MSESQDRRPILTVRFYATVAGNEPVREWLLRLSRNDRRSVGEDIKTAQYGWPLGMPHIRKLEPAQTQMRFEGKTREHYHITCIHCGRIEDAPGQPLHDSLANMENALGNLTKFGIFGHKLEFIGVCTACREAGKAFPVEEAEPESEE